MVDIGGSCVPWYALQVKPRHEKAIAVVLRNKGCEEFLPLCRARRVWSDRIAEIEVPLFPGYIFCRVSPSQSRTPILATAGVMQFVSIGGKPAPIEQAEIEAVQKVIRSGLAAEPWPYLKAGNPVRIEYGSLAGVEGVLLEVKKHSRLVVSVSLLQRSVAVEIEREWVIPASVPHFSGHMRPVLL